ncbi:Gfo/Idh/MocA family protein [Nocardia sp. alder85J]|uniref:Gfo/Idh/MocA family protein n=1 Tax=Nocardia sp. alder85J TaxID=2862949 RepID=UPI001CD5DE32|nr:Gfo/Idh/MocA family oxidoreductase [Nocardia sp. alder85J]MCX4092046.1 Gfo/Idh/MocA family oxidoreductase [Nocardia sp. alder85J]
MDPIRVGIVGASPDRGWAIRAHLPALRALPDYRISAVGTSRPDSARAAADLFDARPFTDPRALAEHPEVDLVAITVKVPAHAELIRSALAAGKHVYCEWPLALTTGEARELAALAARAGVRHVAGLQARYAPAVRRARELITEGAVGQILSVTVHESRGKGAGGVIPAWATYTLDRDNGAGLLEVAGGHLLSAVRYLLGDLTELSARLAIRLPYATVPESGAVITVTSPDQLLLTATAGGVPVSAHIHDGRATGAGTRIDISGTAGDLAIVSGAGGPGGIQMSALHLSGALGPGRAPQPIALGNHGPASDLPLEAVNVAALYTALATDLRTGAHTVPDFELAVDLHRLLDDIRRSDAEGVRIHRDPRAA